MMNVSDLVQQTSRAPSRATVLQQHATLRELALLPTLHCYHCNIYYGNRVEMDAGGQDATGCISNRKQDLAAMNTH
ncbi:uncharacterized protein V6R79_000185 [Siganus canaliculatus]